MVQPHKPPKRTAANKPKKTVSPEIASRLSKNQYFSAGERLAPTDVIRAPDGSIYLSERAGRSFLAAQEAILRKARKGRE
jgi:hypothetical protein